MRHNHARLITLVTTGVLLAAIAPAAAIADPATKHLGGSGEVPKKWDLPKPDVQSHRDEVPASASGSGTGWNSLGFSAFDSGDMVVALGTATGHAGIWSDTLFNPMRGKASYCVWSANTSPSNGVQLEQPRKYNAYDRAFGLWVPSRNAYGRSAVNYCAAQVGEPYDIMSAKSDRSRWYCSKLPWAGWKTRAGVDLDADGGYWVWPVDLVNDDQTRVFAAAY